MIKFEKVSYAQFEKELLGNSDSTTEEIKKIYNHIKLPKRATIGSAGYDFYAPFSFSLAPKKSIKIPTGIRAFMSKGVVLQCYPRSGLGFKFRLQLDCTVGIIDSDYYYSDNEGQIFAKLTNDSNVEKTVFIEDGQSFMQGIFMQYLTTDDDNTVGVRNGGFGSTDKKNDTLKQLCFTFDC